MVLSKYNQSVIEFYTNNLLSYLENIETLEFLNTAEKQKITIQGFNTMLRVLSIVYHIQMSEQQIQSYLEKSNLLFIEYTEQVYLRKTDMQHSPTMFVYNVLIGTINMNAYLKTIKTNDNNFIFNFVKWAQLLLFWNNNKISNQQRKYIVKNFFHCYLTIFTNESLFGLYRVFEILQDHINNDSNVFDIYSMLLTSFQKFFQKKTFKWKASHIEDLCFDKFFKNNDYVKKTVSEITSIKQMDDFVIWIFNDNK